MFLKKNKGKVFGAKFTKDEQKAVNIEIQKSLADYIRKHEIEIDAMILWHLHEQLQYGPKRLWDFFKGFAPATDALADRYDLESDEDKVWLYTQKLKEYGIDVEEWREKIKTLNND